MLLHTVRSAQAPADFEELGQCVCPCSSLQVFLCDGLVPLSQLFILAVTVVERGKLKVCKRCIVGDTTAAKVFVMPPDDCGQICHDLTSLI